MFKFAIFFTLCFVTIKAQVDPFEICKGYPDGTLIGPGEDVSCNLYYYCESEYGFEEFCEEGFEFNYETNECDYDDVVNCAANLPLEPEPEPETIPPTTTVSPVTSPPVSTTTDSSIADIECPTNRPGEILFFPSSNCTEYFICANGVRMRMTCMEGFTWNQDERTCDYPIFSKCSVRFKSFFVSKIKNIFLETVEHC